MEWGAHAKSNDKLSRKKVGEGIVREVQGSQGHASRATLLTLVCKLAFMAAASASHGLSQAGLPLQLRLPSHSTLHQFESSSTYQ